MSVVHCRLSAASKTLNAPRAEELTTPLSIMGPAELIISGHLQQLSLVTCES
jgi:hypothetical protein